MKLFSFDDGSGLATDWLDAGDSSGTGMTDWSGASNATSSAAIAGSQVLYLTEPGTTAPISVSDIHQGGIGDCFLLSPIGDIAEQDPSFISSMIKSNSNGTETVTLHVAANGSLPSYTTTAFKTVTETVTNSFPTYAVNGAGQDSVNGVQEIWPQVLESAVAQLDGGYAAIANGGSPLVAMEELTGQATSYMAPRNLSLAMLNSFVAQGDLLVMDTLASGALPDNLVNNHAYIFAGVSGTGAGATVKLLNPWGTDQPSPILLSQLSKGITEVDIGKV